MGSDANKRGGREAGERGEAFLIIRVRLQEDTNRGECAAENYVAVITCKNTAGVKEKNWLRTDARELYHIGNKRESKRNRRK